MVVHYMRARRSTMGAPLTDEQEQLDPLKILSAQLTPLRVLVANHEARGKALPIKSQLAIDDIERQIADVAREPTRQ